MSARSRSLNALADHMEWLRDGGAGSPGKDGPEIYTARDIWERGADMARRTADEQTWTARFLRLFPLSFQAWLEQIRVKHETKENER